MAQTFRAGVGIVVVNARGEVLALKRSGALSEGSGSSAWQLPQGGIEIDEESEQAWSREFEEETNIPERLVTLLGEYPEWLAYELPADVRTSRLGRGQVQKWFFVRLDDESIVDPKEIEERTGEKAEFSCHQWMSLKVLAEQAWPPRRPIYRKLVERPAELVDPALQHC